MASGKKNYFRHSFHAGKDDKIVDLIAGHGKQAYFHYFRLLELCGEQAADSVPEKFVFHRRTLCAELMVTNSRLGHHLLAMQSSLLLEYVLSDRKVEILIPKFTKYLGKYTNKKPSNTSNKRKEKEIKEKESKINKKEIKKNILDSSPLEHLTDNKMVKEWLRTGTKPIQEKLLETYSDNYLKDLILTAYSWSSENNKNRKAGTFLKTWAEKDQNKELREVWNSPFKGIDLNKIDGGL